MLHKFYLSLVIFSGCLFVLMTDDFIPSSAKARAIPAAALIPLTNIVQVTTRYDHTCALTTAGGVLCWGSNAYGQLGDGTITDRLTPVLVVGLESGVQEIAAGGWHTCAVKTVGSVFCWGRNHVGQMGDGTTTDRLTPVAVVGLASDVVAISAGAHFNCALKTSSGLRCWGENTLGMLGDGTTTNRLTPITPVGLNSGVQIVTAAYRFACVALAPRGAKCWGWNGDGQLGDGTVIERLTPVYVEGFEETVIALATGGTHTCAASADGVAQCWGAGDTLGDGLDQQRLTPQTSVLLDTAVSALTAGVFHACALTIDHAVYCWGSNSHGALGDGTIIDRTAPVGVISLSSGVQAIASGDYHNCAIVENGGLHCWGENNAGQLGDGTTSNRLTPVPVMIDETVIPIPTVTPTATTPPPTATPTATSTLPPPATATATPPPVDGYEPNDTCVQASPIPSNGSAQTYAFHQAADIDWARFDATANTTYRIEVIIPANSPADVTLEVYANCDSLPTDLWNQTFTPGVRLDVAATTSGPLWLRLSSQNGAGGVDVRYELTVRPLGARPNTGAVIIVAGRFKTSDTLQRNIHNVTNRVYTIFQAQGYTNDDIYYLATDSTLTGYDAAATQANLRNAITQWAVGKVGSGKALTLYLMDHGNPDSFYLDGANRDILTPAALDEWLTTFEAAVPGASVNVIIEACFIGSFIAQPHSISKANRVIITSSDNNWNAYASPDGAHFSDHFLTALQQGRNLFTSFSEAQREVNRRFGHQNPWLDANGDGTPNQQADFAVAAERGFAYAGTLRDDSWPPFIATANGPITIDNRRGLLSAEVRDDKGVASVWVTVYAPSYVPPTNDTELLAETAPTLLLTPQGNAHYAVEYPAFDEVGTYQVVFSAKDELGNLASSVEVKVTVGSQLFLPLIAR